MLLKNALKALVEKTDACGVIEARCGLDEGHETKRGLGRSWSPTHRAHDGHEYGRECAHRAFRIPKRDGTCDCAPAPKERWLKVAIGPPHVHDQGQPPPKLNDGSRLKVTGHCRLRDEQNGGGCFPGAGGCGRTLPMVSHISDQTRASRYEPGWSLADRLAINLT